MGGKKNSLAQKSNIKRSLDEYLNKNGVLDAEQIVDDWFPEVEADIFLSHSHLDEDIALTLSGLFYREFGLTTFINSPSIFVATPLVVDFTITEAPTTGSLVV